MEPSKFSNTSRKNQQKIRNFCIIAHIDHGKTTLTDRILQATHAVESREFQDRMMDSNPIERERGITIKLAPVRMQYMAKNGEEYQFNLIDTPGHVDFGYEVSRSLAACEGALLVVDATQGVQAQTLSNYEKAKALGLTMIPVINKIDLPASDVEGVKKDLIESLGFAEEEIVCVSAKSGLNLDVLLEKIAEKIPAPRGNEDDSLRVLVFSSVYDPHKGVIAYVRVVDGELNREKLVFMATDTACTPTEVGIFSPQRVACGSLKTGEVGYIATGLKDVSLVRVGDTITTSPVSEHLEPLEGYKEPQPLVFLEFYPIDGDEYASLLDAAAKLQLHDAALFYQQTHSPALGNGLRFGFLGVLHSEIVQERLEREFGLELIATSPTIPYEIALREGKILTITNPSQLPPPESYTEIREPVTLTQIFTPEANVGDVMRLCERHRAQLQEMVQLGSRIRLSYFIPLAEIIVSFHDELKSVSSGFASMEYELVGYEPVDAVKLDILIHHDVVDPLSQIVVREQAEMIGRRVVKKLKDIIPKQQFEVAIQAAIGGKVVARESLSAYRKDVTAKLYGGDQTRKDKLLKKQKKGKKRMKEFGKVSLPQEAFLSLLER